jgi:GTP cyclohydrolase IA
VARLKLQNHETVTEEEAEQAVRTLIRWAGDDPFRKGLLDTPKRVTRAYKEFFVGYETNLTAADVKLFDKTKDYDEIISLTNIRVESFCEHHMLPVIGKATIAYIPKQKIIGLSKIPKILDMYAKRLQIQERLVVRVANALHKLADAKGVGVSIECEHHCVTTRGVHKTGTQMRTSHLTGCFKEGSTRIEFFELVNQD